MIKVIDLDNENKISFDKACNTYCLSRFLVKKYDDVCFIVLDRCYNPEKKYLLFSI